MERLVLSALFYGAMILIIVTCGAEWLRFHSTPEWVGALGSWFGGGASFSAVAAALWIAFSQKRQQEEIKKSSDARKSKLLYYKADRYCTKIILGLLAVDRSHYDTIFDLEQLRENEEVLRGKFSPNALHVPRMQLDELTYIDDISRDIIEIYERIDHHEQNILSILGRNKGEMFHATYDMLFANITEIKKLAVRVKMCIDESHR